VYVSWHDLAAHGWLYVARSHDGGATFEPAVKVVEGEPWGAFIGQLGIGPGGDVHFVWTPMLMTLPTAPPGADRSVWHVVSRDGGRTWSVPRAIAPHAGLALIGILAFGVDPRGELLVVWGQGGEVPGDRLAQVRHRLYAVRSGDGGRSWTDPALVSPDLPATTTMGLPAVAGDGRAWWILAHLADDEATEVVVLRSTDGGKTFVRDRSLGRRPVQVDDIYLHGNYALYRCADVVRVGDYSSIAAAGGRVLAAYVLPSTDDPLSPPATYVDVA
jgi:hypothetical protein